MDTIFTRIIEDCQLRNLSENTQISYLRIARQYFDFYNGISPDKPETEEMRMYLLHLIKDKHQAPQTLDVAYSALT